MALLSSGRAAGLQAPPNESVQRAVRDKALKAAARRRLAWPAAAITRPGSKVKNRGVVDERPTGPEELIDGVHDPQSFVEFAKSLYLERAVDDATESQIPSSPYGPTHAGWENTTIHSFLEAAVAWAIDSDFSASSDNPWRQFARFLIAGKSYG